jgi:hypothetical protein
VTKNGDDFIAVGFNEDGEDIHYVLTAKETDCMEGIIPPAALTAKENGFTGTSVF